MVVALGGLVAGYGCGGSDGDGPPADGPGDGTGIGGDDASTGTTGTEGGVAETDAGASDGAAVVDAGVDSGPVDSGPLSPSYVHYDINHILSTGQSNAVSNGGTPVLSTTQPYANVMFNTGVMTAGSCDGDGCTVYQTPASFLPLVEGDRFFGYAVETMSSALANRITQASRDVFLVGAPKPSHDLLVSLHARSGNPYYCLRKGGCDWWAPKPYIRPFSEALMQINSAKTIAAGLGKSYVVRAVTTLHGETDHYYPTVFPHEGTDGTPNKIKNYADALVEWQADFDSSIKAATGQTINVPLLVAQISGWTNVPYSAILQHQYDAHVRAPGKVVLVTPAYMLPFQNDCLHYTPQSERRLGEYFAKAYNRIVFQGVPWEPVRPRSLTLAGSTLTVVYFVPAPPLVLDTTRVTDPGNFGFEYADASASPATITKVQVSAPDTVTITLSKPPGAATGKRLYYAARSYNPAPPNVCPGPFQGPRGNLRDSDATTSRHGYDLHNWGVQFNLPIP